MLCDQCKLLFLDIGEQTNEWIYLSTWRSKIKNCGFEKKAAVIITNHIQTDPIPHFSSYDAGVPTGGNIINYASTHIVRVRKTSDYTNASLIKSNYLAYNESYFIINKKGIDDI